MTTPEPGGDGAVTTTNGTASLHPNPSVPTAAANDEAQYGLSLAVPDNDISRLFDSLQSQPMTATASTSSLTAAQENDENGTATPYGTRSRNRAGGPRPNYADDKELDLEIEAAGRIQRPSGRKTGTPTNGTRDNDAAASQSRPSCATMNASAFSSTTANAATKDAIPGTSTFSANPTAPAPSKKRKHPGSSSTSSTSRVNHVSTGRARAHLAAQPRQQAETNMMSFDGCGARLNARGELVADDGTVLKPNGTAGSVIPVDVLS